MKRRRLALVRPRGCRKPLGTTVRLAPEYEELVLEDARRLG